MSIFSIQARKHTAFYDNLVSASVSRTPARERPAEATEASLVKRDASSAESACEDSRLSDRSRPVNRTYVISALSKSGGGQQTAYRSRLTLQRRSRRKTGAETREDTVAESSQNTTPAPQKRLTLQRRTRTPSMMDKSSRGQRGVSGTNQPSTPKVLGEPNGRTPALFRSTSLRETVPKTKEAAAHLGRSTQTKTPSLISSTARQLEEPAQTFKTPTKRTPFEKIASKRDVFEKLANREAQKLVPVKSASLERPRVQQAEEIKPLPAPRVSKASTGVQERKTTTSNPKGEVILTRTSSESTLTSEVQRQQDSFKMENSAVTVAVRVRPFSAREKTEKASQVIFMNGQEMIVQHPESKQSYSFTYDFSFCSVDDGDPAFASQKTVYQTLAKPLLFRAFEGFNTCLFAYGQTGSGKSYTMMGFEEEAGVIPRFCQELFIKLASMVNEEVKCHVEMSYFEVYNEKIHDLLVTREEPHQRRMPLRVREHPVHGPYVAELSANVVSSYTDIKGWLELGNKQRATAATGMNDKSSRSHSVFTLVMTQTKTEFVEGEEHDHSIISRINLVDLAGSERCNSAQTSGERLREGASINKSLLTLGKVISALSEQALTRKKVFTPYRESVLTWLLKESLGGNSKTAMIATVSPAGSNVEESLSTLRYAQQARTIINVAKVNEDTSAKLIRELKAEVEKLRAAQMSSQGVEPHRVRLFQQEISTLKNKLSQQEREMAECFPIRAWREKLEQAEVRKHEETKELQKAGVTFKVDNRLPNLVNLNEDPQLSEMLLYMIKEGRTTVGKLKAGSIHDIQLTGALIADQHCVISNIHNTVSITPVDDAKTFVNGNLISESTVLHHGDRIILGGDHYFRFNHPAEVQSGKRVSCWTSASDGHKDFEFAKNELLAAQRAKLEAEIEEAHLKAKEEMMQGIQMAKEVAQKELCNQKTLYENRIQALERELEEESQRKRLQEVDQQKVATQMKELKVAKMELEKEVDTQKKLLRLHMEAQWGAMKLSLMIEEANKISVKLKKHTVFSRYESSDRENPEQPVLQVRVQNTKLGISTFWSLDKFQNNMAAMRELESRSLLKSKRISGRLYEIRVHPIQSLSSSSHSAGKKLQPLSSTSDPAMSGICKELIGRSMARLRSGTEESLADRLISDLNQLFGAVQIISDLYESLDEDSQDSGGSQLNLELCCSYLGSNLYYFGLLMSSQSLDAAAAALGHLAVVTGMALNITRLGSQPTGKVTPAALLKLCRKIRLHR
uniref:Kinesin-like protein KIF14 n=1 Tax=Nothobranchius furzeri TaxID=105023 RepID=A0A8C6Q697_NOTFU